MDNLSLDFEEFLWANTRRCAFFAFILRLPQILFYVSFEGGFLCPAVVFKGLAYVAFYIGSQWTGAVVVFIVALTGVDIDKVVLDSSLHTSWHVVIHGDDAGGHTDRLVLAELRTVGRLHLGIVEVDAVGVDSVCWCVTA